MGVTTARAPADGSRGAGRLVRLAPLVLLVVSIPSASYAPALPTGALAPMEILAAGFGSPRGVGVDAAGNVYVADGAAGTVTKITPDHTRTLVATGLEHPIGLAFDLEGRLLVAEARAGRVVRIEADGRRTPVMTDVTQPRWLAVSDAGRLFVSARGPTRERDRKADDESAEAEMILTVGVDGRPAIFADGFEGLQGLAVGPGAVYATAMRGGDDGREAGMILRIPILADGGAGSPTRLGRTNILRRPVGLARDHTGALYVTTRELGALEKLHVDGALTLFASNLDDPQGLAFDLDGDLLVADGRAGRVVRFRAPPPPSLAALPAFTSLAALTVRGTAEPSAHLEVFLNAGPTPVTAAADAAGRWAVSVGLALDAENLLEVFATGGAGAGLSSAPVGARLTHDGVPPSLTFQAPAAGAFVRQVVPVAAEASDAGSRLGSVALGVGTHGLGGSVTPRLPAPAAVVIATWNTTGVADGPWTLMAIAVDQAGNSSMASRAVIVDNTPPAARITGGPAATMQGTDVTFTFAGTDNLTPVTRLAFAWRVDDGAWSAFGSATSATLSGLARGPHLFEVSARDLAGNAGAAAQQRFTVGGLGVAITVPADGATVAAGLLVVRGIVDADGAEVGVTVNGTPAAIHGTTFMALLPLASETTELVASATTTSGATATDAVSITVTAPGGEGAILHASPQNGSAPLTVSFSLTGVAAGTITLDLEDDGVVDFTGPSLAGQRFIYARPGLYVATATALDGEGRPVTTRTLVQAYDVTSLDSLLQAKWRAVRDALRVGDVARAVADIGADSRDEYRAAFQIIAARLPAIDTILTDLTLVRIGDATALYRATRTDAGVAKSFDVRFAVDGDGVWRVERF